MFRTAWRLGLRDLLLHKRRSALIVLLVLLPVGAVVAGGVGAASLYPTPGEAATRQLGTAQAELGWLPRVDDDRVCPQWPTTLGNVHCNEGERISVSGVPDTLAEAVPGYRAVGVRVGGVEVQRPLASGRSLPTRVDATVIDLAAPEFAGRWGLVAGQAATGSDVVVSRPLARAFGVEVGGTLATDKGEYRIAGVVAAPGLKGAAVFLPPGHPLAADVAEERVFLVGDQPIEWAQVQVLNRQGVQALSRAVVLDPPFTNDDGPDRVILLIALVAALGGLMVMFVAGSAFAVGVRASRRQLGLLGAVGAPAGVLRRLVLGQALALGGIGALLGVGLGIAVGRLGSLWLSAADQASIWGFHVPWLAVAAAALVGVLACVAAAWGPARTVMKVDALEAVRSAEVATPRARTPWLGLASGLLGVAAMAAAIIVFQTDTERPWYATRPEAFPLVGAGLCLLTVGVALSLHPLIALVARHVPRRPLAVRLAVRDVDRSRSRVVPAVAAVVTATTLATVATAAVVGTEEGVQARAVWRVHPTHVVVHVIDDTMDPDVAAAAVEYALGAPATRTLLASVRAELPTPEANVCPGTATLRPDPDDWRCDGPGPGSYPHLVVGDAPQLAALLGREPLADELADLRGGVLLTSSRLAVADGRAQVRAVAEGEGGGDGDPGPPGVAVPARLIEVSEASGWSIMSPARAAELGLPAAQDALVLDVGRRLTAAENDEVDAVLRELGFWSRQLPRDPAEARFPWGWLIAGVGAAIILAVVGLVTALGAADSRRDEATLASVGAPAGLRRATTAGQVLVVAGLGSLLGAAVGVLGVVAYTQSQPMHHGLGPVIPWVQLLALAVGLPVAGALAAWLVTPPSRAAAQRVLT